MVKGVQALCGPISKNCANLWLLCLMYFRANYRLSFVFICHPVNGGDINLFQTQFSMGLLNLAGAARRTLATNRGSLYCTWVHRADSSRVYHAVLASESAALQQSPPGPRHSKNSSRNHKEATLASSDSILDSLRRCFSAVSLTATLVTWSSHVATDASETEELRAAARLINVHWPM